MKVLSIDIETYSSISLPDCGVYKYIEAEDFEILLFGYSVDAGPVILIDLAQGEEIPHEIKEALLDVNIIKTAFNANFERLCIDKFFNIKTEISSWHCTKVHAAELGLPGHLADVAKVLKLEEQKDSAGKALIRFFSIPCKPTKANNYRTRNYPQHDIEKWNQFKAYCIKDVEVETAIKQKLDKFPVEASEHRLWVLDQRINDAGVVMDKELILNAITIDEKFRQSALLKAAKLTGLDNPNSVSQLRGWIQKEEDIELKTLDKAKVKELINATSNPKVKKVLELRQELSKTSVKKYYTMESAMCKDERIRGLMQFYGASRTGRWAGRLVQPQNLPRNDMEQLDLAREILKYKSYEGLDLLFESIPDTLSQLIRTAFIAKDNHRLIVADYSAIEARVIAYMAGEQWRLDVFSGHGKIYEASASQMFGVPIEQIDKGSPLRQKGKISELALGYGGGPGALMQMGALNMGLTEDELPDLVSTWRSANTNIVKFWRECENAALEAIKCKKLVKLPNNLEFSYRNGILFIKLPSGRSLAYMNATIEKDPRFNRDSIYYMGSDTKGWSKLNTYGGKLVENIIQAIARDCLGEAMLNLDSAGYKIILHVHDEVIIEAKEGEGSLKEVCEIMAKPISWAEGLPLNAEGYETKFYKKD